MIGNGFLQGKRRNSQQEASNPWKNPVWATAQQNQPRTCKAKPKTCQKSCWKWDQVWVLSSPEIRRKSSILWRKNWAPLCIWIWVGLWQALKHTDYQKIAFAPLCLSSLRNTSTAELCLLSWKGTAKVALTETKQSPGKPMCTSLCSPSQNSFSTHLLSVCFGENTEKFGICYKTVLVSLGKKN